MVPGFLQGCRELWGIPEEVGVFSLPRLKGYPAYPHVGMWWHPTWGRVYAWYTSPVWLQPYGAQWRVKFNITIAEHGAETDITIFRNWAKADSSQETSGKHFHGFPASAEVDGPTFR